MAVEDDDDRRAMLADFGIQVEIGGQLFTGILDNEWQDQNGISVTVPVLTMLTSETEDLVRGQVVYTEAGVKYTIQEPMPDGQGITHFILQAE